MNETDAPSKADLQAASRRAEKDANVLAASLATVVGVYLYFAFGIEATPQKTPDQLRQSFAETAHLNGKTVSPDSMPEDALADAEWREKLRFRHDEDANNGGKSSAFAMSALLLWYARSAHKKAKAIRNDLASFPDEGSSPPEP